MGVTKSWEQLRDFHFRHEISLVQSLNRVQLFATPRTAARQASLSITNSRSLLQLLSIESVMPSNHLIQLLSPSPLTFNLSQHQGLFKWVSSSHQVAKCLQLSFTLQYDFLKLRQIHEEIIKILRKRLQIIRHGFFPLKYRTFHFIMLFNF